MSEWEDVNVPRGSFIGWGRKGQQITGEVISYDERGGSDFNQESCPLVVIELTQEAENYRDKGTRRETIEAGEFVSVTCGQANLKAAIRAAALEPGFLVRIAYVDDYKTGKGEGKEFKVQVNRSRKAPAPKPSSNELV